MRKITLTIPDFLFQFYENVGKTAGGIKPEKVMSDALFKLAGELSLHALYEKES